MEDSILDFYSNYNEPNRVDDPQLARRRFGDFLSRWNLTEKQGLLVLVVYGMKIFDQVRELTGSPDQIKRFLSDFYFERFLQSNHPAARHYHYYRENIGSQSVPEMAAALGISTGTVYSELYLLRISTINVYRSILEGLTSADASNLGSQKALSEQFLSFVRHHLHEGSRGESWNRHLRYANSTFHEEQLLAHLHDLGLSYEEIANTLANAPSADPLDLTSGNAVRTPSSVGAKLRELGLTNDIRQPFKTEVFDPQYGLLKVDGTLQAESVWLYLRDHRTLTADAIAQRLGISKTTLRRFLIRNRVGFMEHSSLQFPGIGPNQVGNELAWESIEKKANDFSDGIEKVVAWIARHPGQVPSQLHMRLHPPSTHPKLDVVGVSSKICSMNGITDFWLAVKEATQRQGVRFNLLDIGIKRISEEQAKALRPHWQREVLELSEAYMSQDVTHDGQTHPTGTWPWTNARGIKSKSFEVESTAERTGQIPVPWSRISASDKYLIGKSAYHSRVFDNGTEYFLSLQRYVNRQDGIEKRQWANSLLLIDAFYLSNEVTDELRENWRIEAINKIHRICLKRGQIPTLKELAVELGVNVARLVGRGVYGPASPSYALRIFDSTNQMFKALFEKDQVPGRQADATKRIWWVGLNAHVLSDTDESPALLRRLNLVLKREVLEIALKGVLDGKSEAGFLVPPTPKEWELISGGRDRIMSLGFYKNSSFAIFSSMTEFYRTLQAWLAPEPPVDEHLLEGNEALIELRRRVLSEAPAATLASWRKSLEYRLSLSQ